MNSFLAREIVIRLVLTTALLVIPIIIGIRKLLPSTHTPLKQGSSALMKTINQIIEGLKSRNSKRKTVSREKKLQKELYHAQLERARQDLETDDSTTMIDSGEDENRYTEDELQDQYIESENTEEDSIENEDSLLSSDESQEIIKSNEPEQETIQKENTEISNSPQQKASSGSKTFYRSELDQQKFNKQIESIKYAALTYKERGKADKYEKKLIEGLSLDQENQEFMNMLADHYFNHGNHVKALTLLKKIVTVQTQNHKAIWQIGRIYQDQNKAEAAQLLIEKALEQKPDHPKYLISLVEVHYEKGDKRQALEIMERLRKLRPTNIDYLLTVATLHEELNEPTFARNYYMKILEIDPLNEHAKAGMRGL